MPSDPSLCRAAGWLLNLQHLTLGERIGQGEFGGEMGPEVPRGHRQMTFLDAIPAVLGLGAVSPRLMPCIPHQMSCRASTWGRRWL